MMRALEIYRGYVRRDSVGHEQIWAGREVAWKENLRVLETQGRGRPRSRWGQEGRGLGEGGG